MGVEKEAKDSPFPERAYSPVGETSKQIYTNYKQQELSKRRKALESIGIEKVYLQKMRFQLELEVNQEAEIWKENVPGMGDNA